MGCEVWSAGFAAAAGLSAAALAAVPVAGDGGGTPSLLAGCAGGAGFAVGWIGMGAAAAADSGAGAGAGTGEEGELDGAGLLAVGFSKMPDQG